MEGPVIATTGHQPSVSAKLNATHLAGVPPQRRLQSSRIGFPQPDSALRVVADTTVADGVIQFVRSVPDTCRGPVARRFPDA